MSRQRTSLRIFELMLLVAGLALAIWIFLDELRRAWGPSYGGEPFFGHWDAAVFMTLVVGLGGLSLVGVPLLLIRRLRAPRQPWGAGCFLWFTQGMASWLLWPPIVYRRIQGASFDRSMTAPCYVYGTPLMAIYVTAALLVGGQLRRSKRRRAALAWHERFGLIVGLLWACTGLYLLAMFYREDFTR